MATPPSLNIIPETYKARLTENANDFDSIVTDMCDEIMELRKMLCSSYAKHPYTDDGELQDNYWPPIDFNRDPIEIIQKRMSDRTINAYNKEHPK